MWVFVFVRLPVLSLAADLTGLVVGLLDGDTIEVLHNGRAERIRLNGIDCPEERQAFGNRAKQFTVQLVFGKDVTVMEHGPDKYGRIIADVTLPDVRMLKRELVGPSLVSQVGKLHWGQALNPAGLALRGSGRGRGLSGRGPPSPDPSVPIIGNRIARVPPAGPPELHGHRP